jgi:hypothetical protein
MSVATRPLPSEAAVKQAEGHRFPGGIYTVQHWENFLLTECTGAELLPGGMVHPVVLFHMPILGSGTTIAEMFALGLAESDFSIGIESYDWEMFKPLIEETAYSVNGRILSVERKTDGKRGPGLYDRIQFEFTVAEADGGLAARTTITWHYNRSEPA